jgi:hypothetical protein
MFGIFYTQIFGSWVKMMTLCMGHLFFVVLAFTALGMDGDREREQACYAVDSLVFFSIDILDSLWKSDLELAILLPL